MAGYTIPPELNWLTQIAAKYGYVESEDDYLDLLAGKTITPVGMRELCDAYVKVRHPGFWKHRDRVNYYLKKSTDPQDHQLLESINRVLRLLTRLADGRVGPFFDLLAPLGRVETSPTEAQWAMLPADFKYLVEPAQLVSDAGGHEAGPFSEEVIEELKRWAPRIREDASRVNEWIKAGSLVDDPVRWAVYDLMISMDEADLL